ncbi:c-type cytochrome [Rhodovulum kholense]|uniref:Cytochrome c553 n=1 Tax=Rhodovulum kholense TaxID=453584 RepID=A0A8E2VJ19_9RHOB|nr:c-type cytochrome [Rhodovulum kholense]PTW49485.1 cytochrome c553 [Rhodovulum kholense]
MSRPRLSLSNPRRSRLLIGLGAVAVALVLGAAAALKAGLVPVSARPPHAAATAAVLHETFRASVERSARQLTEAGLEVPDLDDPGLIALGAQHYDQVCSSCHGGPGLGQSPVALSMRPRPQSLPAVVGEFSETELYVILRDGVRFTAMPSWPADGNFGEIWAVVAFLRQLPDMTPDAYRDATEASRGAAEAALPAMAWDRRGAAMELKLHARADPLEDYLYSAPSTGWRPIGLGDTPLRYCVACHGTDGTGAPTGGQAPNLAILDADTIATRLRDYASGARQSGIMATVATSLSGPQIDALAEHFAGLPDRTLGVPPSADIEADTERGAALVRHGDFAQALPACGLCHGTGAEKAGLGVPPLAGQGAAFLKRRLDGFASGQGPDRDGWNPMPAIARALSPADRSAVAAYLAALPAGDPLSPDAAAAPGLEQATEKAIALAQSCTACHDPGPALGADRDLSPNLTLQSPAYIAHQMALFDSGRRPVTTMQQAAHELTETEIGALAAVFGTAHASLSGPDPERRMPPDFELSEAGALARDGDPGRGVPACLSCHGAAPTGAIGLIPRLDGQRAGYLQDRLDYFAEEKAPEVLAPMTAIAARLTDSERAALADWFAARPPLEK